MDKRRLEAIRKNGTSKEYLEALRSYTATESICIHDEGSHYCFINRAAKCNKCGAIGWHI